MLLSPLPLPTEPGQRVHADLFGPLKTSDKGKKFILCMTDAFTKYVKLVALPNKEAVTVIEAIFDKWICHFRSPLDLVTHQGTEFCAKLVNKLFTPLGTFHLTKYCIIHSAIAKQKSQTKQSQNTSVHSVTTPPLTGHCIWHP
jgi:Integrase core domain